MTGQFSTVMRGLVPGIPMELALQCQPKRDGRDKPGPDDAHSMKIPALEQQLRVDRMLAAGEFRGEQIAAFAQPIFT
jgi:hypothetical protein